MINLVEKKKYNRKDYIKNYVKKNSKKLLVIHKEFRENIKLETLYRYSYGTMECACCGETIIGFLTIDHINNNGAEHRRKLFGKKFNRLGGYAFYAWLKRHGYPEGYQVMCYNCNCGRDKNNGICPHKFETFINNCESITPIERFK